MRDLDLFAFAAVDACVKSVAFADHVIPLAVAAHTMVKWSHTPGKTNAHRSQQRTPYPNEDVWN